MTNVYKYDTFELHIFYRIISIISIFQLTPLPIILLLTALMILVFLTANFLSIKRY